MQEIITLKNIPKWSYLVNKLLNNREISIDTKQDWEVLNKYFPELKNYFEVMNYALEVDEQYAFAYLRELDGVQESLTIKNKMSHWSTLLLCLLREVMYRRETDQDPHDAIIVTYEEMKEALGVFLKDKFENDEKKLFREITSTIKKVQEYGILTELKDGTFRLNKVLRVKMNIDKMQEVLEMLKGGKAEEEEKGEGEERLLDAR